jgi:hypothetical protein
MIHPDVLAQYLREAQVHHHDYEIVAPEHDWADWYAAYTSARLVGATVDKALRIANVHIEEKVA